MKWEGKARRKNKSFKEKNSNLSGEEGGGGGI